MPQSMEVSRLQLARRSASVPPPALFGEQRPSLRLGLQLSLTWSWHSLWGCFLPRHSMSLWNEASELLTTICIIISLHVTHAQKAREKQVLACPFQGSKASGQLGQSYWPLTPGAHPGLDSASAKSGCQPETVRKPFLQTPAWRQDSPGVQPSHSCVHLSPLSSCVFHPSHHASLHLSEPEQPLEDTCSAFMLKLAKLLV